MSSSKKRIDSSAKCFVTWARQMGWAYDSMPGQLSRFAQFASSRSIDTIDQVDAPLLIEYQRHLGAYLSPSTVNSSLGALRVLWRFLLHEELVDHDATATVLPMSENYFKPHIYSRAEFKRIDHGLRELVWQADTHAQEHDRLAQSTALRLLRDCGLRVSEACRRDLAHYDPVQRTLRIDNTKFYKSRTIPLPHSTCVSIDKYLERRQLLDLQPDQQALFVSARGKRISVNSLERQWKTLLISLGLYKPRRKQGRTVFGSTNLHAMRHAFAVSRLEAWQRAGNAHAMLPLLSAYMGHQQVADTTVYLHLTPALRQMASECFARMALPVLDHSHMHHDKEDT